MSLPGSARTSTEPQPPPGRSAPLADHRSRWGSLLQGQEVVIALIGIALAVYFSIASPNFATMLNASTLTQYVAPFTVFAVAEVFILILGEIDLSVGEVYVLTPFLVYYVHEAGLPVGVGIIVSLVIACVIGFINGIITVKLHVPSFITTLGTVFALEGIILISSNGTQLVPAGEGWLASVFGGATWSEIIWAVVIVAVFYVLLRKTIFGLHTIAIGGNELAARESGIRVDTVKIWCFILCSFLGGLMGLLDGYRIGALDPSTDGLTWMFYGVAAAVIGGTALTGGRGTVIGAFIGAIVIGILEDGFHILGVSAFEYTLVLGLAILAAMILNVQVEKRRSGRGGKRGSVAKSLLRTGTSGERRT